MKTYDGGWGSQQGGMAVGNKDGLVLAGEATVWDDLAMPLIGKKLDVNAGKADYDWVNLEVKFSADGSLTNLRDMVGFPLQKMHGIKEDSEARFHMHWVQNDAVPREFTVMHRVQSNGDAHNDSWITTVCAFNPSTNIFPYVSGKLIQITPLVNVDWSHASISSTLQIKFTRTDSVAGTISAMFVDAHVEYDTIGSASEYSKFIAQWA